MRKILVATLLLSSLLASAQSEIRLKKKDRKRDVEMQTTKGTLILRLSDSTPLHRDNFLRLVKSRFYDSILFHRCIPGFVIQAGDPSSRRAVAGQKLGSGGPGYTVPAEIATTLFHQRGVLAAAREGDNVNPERKSSGSQFYIVQGKTFTDHQLDSVERVRLNGRKIDPARREIYRTTGGTPQLDGSYTIYGHVVRGMEVVDEILKVPTSRNPADRPIEDVRILKARLVKRKN